MKSLKASGNILANVREQINILEHGVAHSFSIKPFQENLSLIGLFPLKPTGIEIFQVNIGKMCNQTCKHCHVDAGPDRKEIMTLQTMQQCIDALAANPSFKIVDITGGAPELHPHFRWFVQEVKELGLHIIVRCNLTIILANKRFFDLPEFYKEYELEVISSLPFYAKSRTDKQRGDGVFADSIKALQMLNDVGYGMENSGLLLNLVYNPAGAFLPPAQHALEREFKHELWKQYQIRFNSLYTITNMPISRYLDYLIASGNYEKYMTKLVEAFNPGAASGVMCRNTLSIGWDGYLYDCDFNQMLELKVDSACNHIAALNMYKLNQRQIITNQHCYGCTAGAGSSCGGATA